MRARPADAHSSIPKKQRATHADFQRAHDEALVIADARAVEALAARTVADIREFCTGRRCAIAWSGGKDSIALAELCREAGVTDGVIVVCDLEYPAFTRWVADHRPVGVDVINTGLDLRWLGDHPDMLFPSSSKTSVKWFAKVQWAGQAQYQREKNLDVLCLGRRAQEGNMTGTDGVYESSGVLRFSPLVHWRFEDVIAFLRLRGIALPPFYGWPRGWNVGTGPWAKRKAPTHEQAWREIDAIDRTIVEAAAPYLESARKWIEGGRA